MQPIPPQPLKLCDLLLPTECGRSQTMLWIELYPLQKDANPPSTSECGLICELGHYRGHQLKMRLLGWALMPSDQYPN